MIKEYLLSEENQRILISVKRSSRKSIGLEVRTAGEVIVRIPNRLSDKRLKEFIESHKTWIFQKIALIKQKKESKKELRVPAWDTLSDMEREKIKEKISHRIQYYSKKMQVEYQRVTIRNQKTRWGSCSSKGNLNFNYRLFYLPEELLDYVMVHELAHRRHMNHSPQFWQEVETYCPDYEICRKKLGEYRFATEEENENL